MPRENVFQFKLIDAIFQRNELKRSASLSYLRDLLLVDASLPLAD